MRFAFPSTAIEFVSFMEFDVVSPVGVNFLTNNAGLPLRRLIVAEITVTGKREVVPLSHRYFGLRFTNATR